MSYNRWRPPEEELYHYGVIGMKWGVRRAKSLYRKGDRIIDKASHPSDDDDQGYISEDIRKKATAKYDKASRIELNVRKKAVQKLTKLDSVYQKKQAKADRQFDKAERKAASILTTKRAADRAFRKASKSQYKANRVALKGKRWYEQMSNAYKSLGVEMSESSRKIGEEFIGQVRANSRAMYAASYASWR